MDEAGVRRANEGLADALAEAGHLGSPRVREALLAVPRHLFVPDRAWARRDGPGGAGGGVDRRTDPDGWFAAVYADAVIVIQVDEGRGDPAAGVGEATSSLSAPGIMVAFAGLLGVEEGDRVLEVGTGSGWTGGILAHLAGAGSVLSLEIDAGLAEAAARVVAVLPRRPVIVVADAAVSVPERGVFDRLHVTCGVADVPWPWVDALRLGGVGVMPWSPSYASAKRLRIVRTAEDAAQGSFHGPCGYMMLRSQRAERGDVAAFLHHWDDRETARTPLVAQDLVGDPGADLFVQALVPGIAYRRFGQAGLLVHETGPGGRDSSSWGVVHEGEAHWYGPRELLDEVVAARAAWKALGSPREERFGVTLTPAGTRIWLDEPARGVSGTGSL